MDLPSPEVTPATLAERIVTAPRLSGPESARARLDGWLHEIAQTAAGRSLKQALLGRPNLRALLEGLADGSSYLWELARADPERLVALLDTDPESRLEALIVGVTTRGTVSDGDIMRQLRRMKAEGALLIALADIGGVWPITRVIAALTELADAAVAAAVRHLLADAVERGRYHPADPARPEPGSGFIVLAMAKMGWGELNFSIDIDLIVFYDAAVATLATGVEPSPFYVRLTQRLVKLLQERTADGYVFRTDLRLRPDPGSTQIAVSTAAALDYYESAGQNWERAAMIKARSCAGDIAAGEALLRSLSPFIWRKYLDFAAVADIHAMKRQIHSYRGHDQIAVEGHNIKLGRGGIREIEFFVQTQQLVAGGRHPELRGRPTLDMLETLAEGEWIDPLARQHLAELVPILIPHFARSSNPNGAVLAFDRFLGALQAAGRLLSLLRQNPDLISLFALVLGTAPRLADSLAQFPDIMDAVIDPSFFGALPEEADLALGLNRSLQQAGSDEDFLDRIRIFAQEPMFLVGTRILSGTVSAEQAGEAFARLADTLIRSLHRAVDAEFVKQHGRVRGQETAILALGKLGGREMTATSDLDLIVIYDFDANHPESDGPRKLYGAQYFTRLTQRLINALTAQTNYGVLYQVDMRLRPSGRAGPLATQLDGFASYQETEAWTWEHLALTRARVVSASPAFAARIEEVIRAVLMRSRDARAVAGDVVEMRRAIAQEKGDDKRWDLKYAAGGLVDIEFIAQYLQLVHAAAAPEILDTSSARVLDKAWRLGLLSTQDAEVLRPAA